MTEPNPHPTRAIDAWRDGIARVHRTPVILVCVFTVTLLAALPMAAVMRDSLAAHFGDSMVAEQAARGVNVQWWGEFLDKAGPLGRTFQPTIIGFAAVLDNLGAVADGQARPTPVVWLGAGYMLLWLFLTGGVLDRFARARRTHAHEFFMACGVYFVRFLRLSPFIALAYYVLFGVVHPFLLDDGYGELTRDVTVERTAFLIRLVLYAVFAVLLLSVNIVFDYAKVRAVVEDRRSMVGAIAAGARFVRRHAAAAVLLYLLNGALFVGLLLAYALSTRLAGSSGAGLWISVAVGQLYLLGRLWIRLVFLASETALFQGRLAHAGYIAGAPVVRREPPIVENAL